MSTKLPFIVIVPGASQNPAHYGYLSHLLQRKGYPVFSALLPSVGATEKITVEDDARYVRDKMLLPVLDHEEHDVIMLMHSYSSVPGSVAADGLGKKERTVSGKKTGVIGQIYLSSVLVKGGGGETIVSVFGGGYPPHIRPEPATNLLRCDDRVGPLYHDAPTDIVDAVAVSAMAQGMTSFNSPCPRATWDSQEYEGRVAYIRTLNDAAIPVSIQQMMLDGSGVKWIIKDIESSHSPQVSRPEELADVIVEIAQVFEAL